MSDSQLWLGFGCALSFLVALALLVERGIVWLQRRAS